MTIKNIFEQAFQLYRSNFLKFICIILLIKGPYIVLENFLMELIVKSSAAEASYSTLLFLRFLELIFIAPVLTAVMAIPISKRLLDREVGIAETYYGVLRRCFPLLGTVLLYGIIIGIGYVILIIPGLIFWIWLAFIPQTVMIDGEGGISAMKRSKYLVKGYFSKTLILLMLLFVATSMITAVIALGITWLFSSLGQYSEPLGTGAANVISVILEPFKMVAITFLYYDLRIRKEGFDLEIMAEELEANMNDDYTI